MTFHRLSAGSAFLAFSSDILVGTIALRPPDSGSDCFWYRQPHVFTFGQFAVRPDWQGQGVGRALLDFVERRAARERAHELALDTAEGASHLVRWHQSLGYRQVDFISWHETNYQSIVMSKALTKT